MELDKLVTIFSTILATFTFLVGLAIGLVAGYIIRLKEERKRWNWKALKRSDHYHYERRVDKKR